MEIVKKPRRKDIFGKKHFHRDIMQQQDQTLLVLLSLLKSYLYNGLADRDNGFAPEDRKKILDIMSSLDGHFTGKKRLHKTATNDYQSACIVKKKYIANKLLDKYLYVKKADQEFIMKIEQQFREFKTP